MRLRMRRNLYDTQPTESHKEHGAQEANVSTTLNTSVTPRARQKGDHMTKKVTLVIVTFTIVTLACLGPVVTPTPTASVTASAQAVAEHATPFTTREPDSGAVYEIPTLQPTSTPVSGEKEEWKWIPLPKP
jgi:hypothetical protein